MGPDFDGSQTMAPNGYKEDDMLITDLSIHVNPGQTVAIVGPTAGYFPDSLFARGVDVVGGRVVKNGEQFLQLLVKYVMTTRITSTTINQY